MKQQRQHKVLALSGGVGGAKLALGLSKVLPAQQLSIVVNIADDFDHLGLSISPDLDTIMYTLAGLNDQERGWGLTEESWNAMAALRALEQEDWFQLGDKDLATHIARTEALRNGATLTEVTANLCKSLGVEHEVLPMSDDPVRTIVDTNVGTLSFQHYFVREQCAPQVKAIHFSGIGSALPNQRLIHLLESGDLTAIVICPSNPFVSVDPILQTPGIRQAMKDSKAPVIAISPIVGGAAIKGPAAKMMKELNLDASAIAVAEYYGELLDGFIIDEADKGQAEAIAASGVPVLVAPTLMKTLQDRVELAKTTLAFASER